MGGLLVVDIYFDESRNTGEIGIKGSKLNYFNQRYFILVGYIDDNKITKEYEEFKNRYIGKIYPNSLEAEIKGSDLLTKENNKILDEFIEKFIKNDDLLITIYDKKFFIVTSLLVWLLGIQLRNKYPETFYKYCEFLIKVDDLLLVNFIYASNNNTNVNIKKFLKFLVNYSFDECISIPYEEEIKNEFIAEIENFRKLEDEYIDILRDDIILERVRIQRKNRNNIVNLTALGETVLLLKLNRDLVNKELNLFHDNNEIIEKYMGYYFTQIKVNFLESKNYIQIQLADNVSSIIGKFINNTLPILSDNCVKKALSEENLWIRSRLSKIFQSVNQNNIKMVVSLREQAFLQAYCLTPIQDIQAFKDQVYRNLDIRFLSELSNYLTMVQAFTLFNK